MPISTGQEQTTVGSSGVSMAMVLVFAGVAVGFLLFVAVGAFRIAFRRQRKAKEGRLGIRKTGTVVDGKPAGVVKMEEGAENGPIRPASLLWGSPMYMLNAPPTIGHSAHCAHSSAAITISIEPSTSQTVDEPTSPTRAVDLTPFPALERDASTMSESTARVHAMRV